MTPNTPQARILIPVYNDWASLARLLTTLGDALASAGLAADILVVDDGSSEPPAGLPDLTEAIHRADRLRLTCNLGHQRAIAVGLSHLARQDNDLPVVVMDGDGEDKPEDVPALIEALADHPEADVVFAGRTRRSESPLFKAGYGGYRLLHWLLTGVPIRFGNFSAIRAVALRELVYHGTLWNHYAASVVKARFRRHVIPTSRGQRYAGQSKLNFSNLLVHGFSALSVFSDIICARLFLVAAVTFGLLGFSLIAPVAQGFYRSPLIFLVLGFLLFASLTLNVVALIALRAFPSFIPLRDSELFIRDICPLIGTTPDDAPIVPT